MKLKNIVVTSLSIAGTVMVTGCANIQAVIDRQTACGAGPKAEEAAARLTDEDALVKVISTGQNEKARIAAIKKTNTMQVIAQLICSGDESVDIRSAAFQRLVELGAVNSYIAEDPNFAAIILTGGGYSRGVSRQRGGAGTGVSSSGQGMQFPVEYRLKAIMPVKNAEWPVSDNLKTVALDASAPIEVRTAAIQNADDLSEVFKELMERAGDDDNPAREADEQLVKAFLEGGDLGNENVGAIISDTSLPLSLRQLAFSSMKIKSDKDVTAIRFIINEIIAGDDEQFKKYVLANAPQEALVESLCVNGEIWDCNAFLDEGLNKIADDDLFAKIATRNKHRANIALGAARRIKDLDDPAKKLIVDIAHAVNNPDDHERAAAICRVFAIDPKEAYNVIRYDNNIITSISDKKVVLGLIEMSREKDKDWPQDDKVRKQLMKAIYAIYENYVNGLSKEKAEELMAQAQERAQALAMGGKTCVIGNYYAGMPIVDFILLNKFQDVKATAQLWRQEGQSEDFAVDAFALDTKNLYKATGLEKSELRFGLPDKLGIAEFDVDTTDIKYERNYFAEAMDIYDAGKVTGGDLYFKSENQAKNVMVILWDKTGILEISAL